jgi:hypothetical protein
MTKQHSFLNLDENFQHWLIVDTVRVPDAAELAYRVEGNPELFRLYADSPFQHLLEVSPVVFNFTGSTSFLAEVKNDFALRTSSILLSFSKGATFDERVKHLHNLLSVVVDKKITFFRYYSSEFWNQVSHDLLPHDLDIVLGPFESLSWLDESKHWNSMSRPEGIARTEPKTLPYHLNSPVINKQIQL